MTHELSANGADIKLAGGSNEVVKKNRRWSSLKGWMDVLTIRSFSSVKATFGAGGLDDEACGWAMVDLTTSLFGPLRRY